MSKNRFVTTLIVLMSLSLSVVAGAADRPQARMKKEGGTNTGGSGGNAALITEWCNSSQAALTEAKQAAKVQLLLGNLETARNALREGLKQAANRELSLPRGQFVKNSLTYRSIIRGVEMINALEQSTEGDVYALEAQVSFLDNYYDFISFVGTYVDTQYYIPYYARLANPEANAAFDETLFEVKFIEYAKRQLSWVLETYTQRAPDGSIIPIWSQRAYLKVLEHVTLYAKEDIEGSLWTTRYACVIESLDRLHGRLAQFNLGQPDQNGDVPGSLYVKGRYAVQLTHNEVSALIHQLSSRCGN